MSYRLINRYAVKSDIGSAFDYYRQIDLKLAEQFLFRLREAKAYIVRSPFGFQVKYKEIRTLLMKQFPYHIHYLIEEKRKLIIVLAVIHAYKNPKDYFSR